MTPMQQPQQSWIQVRRKTNTDKGTIIAARVRGERRTRGKVRQIQQMRVYGARARRIEHLYLVFQTVTTPARRRALHGFAVDW